ncbi:hypothetical protein IFM61606_01287 [Aspergillus udagawae]|uniref:Uncharacterized protein n=1 Tax=Aspergillus udagawae TaxID=91492 RepID=A0ABQ1A4I6_9EURO|nr:hypothetical protein IFM53868_01031 [Aspergillus udagawae]GFG21423.1 hypothetical protein IFM61606_01287 [Aspergillus udagawae]
MSMQNQPIFSGKPVEDVDLYIDQCRFMRAGMQMTPEEKKQAIATTLFVGLRDGALRIGRIPQDMVMKLTILRDLYYLDDDDETERRHQLERPSKDDNYQDSDEEEDDNREEEEEDEDENLPLNPQDGRRST